ncbi:hypothetical protein M2352_003376 [Azospirillum fermentarium]|uniref:AAA family ATPase n=1 Tax=Azospirillum fermentarium TaxID=1233114 RepID=UPI002227A506|nr:AAA family ATPase [Azospirillum fermentarium]MCW2247742.1 hypothetical protein [Azospirillum fermentarium]
MAAFPLAPFRVPVALGAAVGAVLFDGDGYQIVADSNGTGRRILLFADEPWVERPGNRGVLDHLATTGRVLRIQGVRGEVSAIAFEAGAGPLPVAGLPAYSGQIAAGSLTVVCKALADLSARNPAASWSRALLVPELPACLDVADDGGEDRRALLERIMTGGVGQGILSVRRIRSINRNLTEGEVRAAFAALGIAITVEEAVPAASAVRVFSLPGRPVLERLLRETLFTDGTPGGAGRPPPTILLHGPPGSGKLHAAQEIARFIGGRIIPITAAGERSSDEREAMLRDALAEAAVQPSSILLLRRLDAAAVSDAVPDILDTAVKQGSRIIATAWRRDAIWPFAVGIPVDCPDAEDTLSLLVHLLGAAPAQRLGSLVPIAARLAGRSCGALVEVASLAADIAMRTGKPGIDDIALFSAVRTLESRTAATGARHPS